MAIHEPEPIEAGITTTIQVEFFKDLERVELIVNETDDQDTLIMAAVRLTPDAARAVADALNAAADRAEEE